MRVSWSSFFILMGIPNGSLIHVLLSCCVSIIPIRPDVACASSHLPLHNTQSRLLCASKRDLLQNMLQNSNNSPTRPIGRSRHVRVSSVALDAANASSLPHLHPVAFPTSFFILRGKGLKLFPCQPCHSYCSAYQSSLFDGRLNARNPMHITVA